MYKLFEIIYNDSGWHSYSLPHAYYIAKNKEEVIANSENYKFYKEQEKLRGGHVWISEITEVVGPHGFLPDFEFENLDEFELSLNVKEK